MIEKNRRKEEIKFINYLNGINFKKKLKKKKPLSQKINKIFFFFKEFFFLYWLRIVTFLLPKSFVDQNVSFARTGEIHQWVWDYYMLKERLLNAGFKNIFKTSFNKTKYKKFKLFKFDEYKKKKVKRY